MQYLITYNNLELVIETKANKVVSYEGNNVVHELVKEHFEQPVEVLYNPNPDSLIDGTAYKILNPGDKDYITAVLIEVIQNELKMTITASTE